MPEDLDDATLSIVAHSLRASIGVATGAVRTIRRRWDVLDAERRGELLELAERGMARVDDALFGIARGLPAEVIAELQTAFDRDEAGREPTSAEEARVAALHRLDVLDQPPCDDLDAIVRLAAGLTDVPIAVINLVDSDRQWQAAAFGAERTEVTREQSMCARIIDERRTVVVPDSSEDPRFHDHPWVTGELGHVRLYAAAPLIAPVDQVIGTLCVFDEQPGSLTGGQVAALEDLAQVVTALFEQRSVAAQLREAAIWQHELISDLERERRRNDHLLERLGADDESAT